ncbi:MAG: hypothetical protein UT13_C0001G0469 [Candidatus Pacebacteria bacterium GW2011_GWF2_38_9]|nr:MAG: hypothetical protein US01_C0001G0482 [candidate division TM6 bacterium GW2011_GWF2_28_16]KKQ10218.1 MAG: hypothetical protein US20_C0002G0019 [Candidatus Pacebacteria bacterium GW2011_GWF1_36_5]KKQ88822.1 MAG: hypothetical protein UT13_C0001G0469 [Candidatus Pacebacteria bacterium GW2011_GWF2_38_9]
MPSSTKNLIRLMLVAIIVLAFMAGFYQSSLSVEKKKYKLLENKLEKLETKIEEMDF